MNIPEKVWSNRPKTINPLSPNGFQLYISRLPTLTYWSQEVELPEITLGASKVATPLVNWHAPGEKLEFNPLKLSFLVDENLENFIAIFDWMIGLGFPTTHDEYKAMLERHRRFSSETELALGFSDGFLKILDSNNLPIKSIIFKDLFPISLNASSKLSSINNSVNYMVADVIFLYTTYNFE